MHQRETHLKHTIGISIINVANNTVTFTAPS